VGVAAAEAAAVIDHGVVEQAAVALGNPGQPADEIREERGRLDEVFRDITTGTKA
jgi:hypothetical protein